MFAVDTTGAAQYVPSTLVHTRQFVGREFVVASDNTVQIRPVNAYRLVAVLI